MATTDDLNIIQGFISSVASQLNMIMIEHPGLLRDNLQESAQAAWNQERWRLEQAHKELDEAIQREGHDLRLRLDDVGLSGKSLEWKVRGFEAAAEELGAARNRHGPFSGLAKRALRPVLGWMNLILGSLMRALPFLEPIKELKEGIELSMLPPD